MVDFGSLKPLKAKLKKQFDHTLCIDGNDSALEEFRALQDNDIVELRVMHDGVGIEMTAKWCFDAANEFLETNYQSPNGARCVKVEVWEHEGNSAIYGD